MTTFEAIVAIGFVVIIFFIALITTALSSKISKIEDDIKKPQNENKKIIYVVSYYCSFDKSWVLDTAYENKEDAEERAKGFLEEGYSIGKIELFKSNK